MLYPGRFNLIESVDFSHLENFSWTKLILNLFFALTVDNCSYCSALFQLESLLNDPFECNFPF